MTTKAPEWTTEKIPLEKLIEWQYNPVQLSKADAKQIEISVRKFGLVEPLVANAPLKDGTRRLLDGHQRKAIMIYSKIADPKTRVDVRVPSRKLTTRECDELTLRLRRNVGRLDYDMLANLPEWDVPDFLDIGFDERELLGAGFDMGDETVDAEPQIEEDRFEEVAKKWKTKLNQLWKIGNHLIYCGDSLNPKSVKFLFNGNKPFLIIADPPYGVNIVAANVSVGGGESEKGMIPFGGVKKKRGYVGGGAAIKASTGFYPIEMRGLRGSIGDSKPFGSKAVHGSVEAAHIVEVGKYPVIIGDEDTNTAKTAVKLYRDLFPDCVHVWWGANYYSDILPPSQCWLVWNKETTGNFADCELAWTNQNKAARLFTHRWNGMLRDSERERRWHPTQKPALLAAWVYEGFIQEGDEILDPFGGAGWSMLGAEMCNRKARVIEKSPEYVAVCLERMSIKFPDLKIERIE